MDTHTMKFENLGDEEKDWIEQENNGDLPNEIVFGYDGTYGYVYPESVANIPYTYDSPEIVLPKSIHELLVENQ